MKNKIDGNDNGEQLEMRIKEMLFDKFSGYTLVDDDYAHQEGDKTVSPSMVTAALRELSIDMDNEFKAIVSVPLDR